LIVIVVIAILALIVIPRVTSATRRSKEAVLKDNLHSLRTGIAMFHADTGVYPAQLSDIVNTTAPSEGYDEGGNTRAIPASLFKGPYLNIPGGIGNSGVPANPFVSQSITDIAQHWTYPAEAGAWGTVQSAVDGTSLEGEPYSSF
jgi:type II secretory pathway pseudopilin PulG